MNQNFEALIRNVYISNNAFVAFLALDSLGKKVDPASSDIFLRTVVKILESHAGRNLSPSFSEPNSKSKAIGNTLLRAIHTHDEYLEREKTQSAQNNTPETLKYSFIHRAIKTFEESPLIHENWKHVFENLKTAIHQDSHALEEKGKVKKTILGRFKNMFHSQSKVLP
jgi:hypothetical protein